MLWLLFATLGYVNPPQDATSEDYYVTLNLRNGGTLPVPATLTTNFEYISTRQDYVAVRGQSIDGRTFFGFEFHSSGDLEQLYAKAIGRLGLNPSNFQRVDQSSGQLSPTIEIFHIEDKSAFPNHLLAIGDRSDSDMVVLFVMVGPRESFYRHTPRFAAMVENYRPDPRVLLGGGRTTSRWSVALLVMLLASNLFFIWLGFSEIARTGTSVDSIA
ncbi:MAG: hypothetical protein QNK37_07810 [Acidobacteriota bacterium]|nr:hypothetical protein [Acidobacteriota bacterium]